MTMNFFRLRATWIIMTTLCCSHTAQSDDWQRLPPLPEPNGGFIAGVISGDLVVLGGTTWRDETKHWLDRIWIYRSRENQWSPVGRLPSAMAYAAGGSSADGLVMVGGSNGKQTHQQLFRLDSQFQLHGLTRIPQRVVYAGGTVAGSQLYVLGGAADAADLKTLSDAFFTIDLTSGKTKTLPAFPGGKVMSPVVVAMGDHLCVFTGAHFDPASGAVVNIASAYAYSIRQAKWSSIHAFPFPVRGLSGAALDERHIYLGGGFKSDQEEFTDEAFLYDVQTDAYQKTTPLPYRAMATLVKSGDQLYCVGGEDQKRHRTDRFYSIGWRQLINRAAVPSR